MTILVGGNACGVGKTTLVCRLIAASPDRAWVAVKVSGGKGDGEPPLPPRVPQPKATERFIAAGAAEAHLIRGDQEGRQRLETLAAECAGRNLIIESNRAVEWLAFDAYLFILDEDAPQPKPPERCHLARATWVLPPRQDPPTALIAAVLRPRDP